VFGALGALVATVGGYLLYDRRRRIQEAAQHGSDVSSTNGEAGEEESLF